jgi:hypothetical protein
MFAHVPNGLAAVSKCRLWAGVRTCLHGLAGASVSASADARALVGAFGSRALQAPLAAQVARAGHLCRHGRRGGRERLGGPAPARDVPNGLAAISKGPAAGWDEIIAFMTFCDTPQDRTWARRLPGRLRFQGVNLLGPGFENSPQ